MNFLIIFFTTISLLSLDDLRRPLTDVHPIHISNTEINYNGKEKNVEIICRIYTDDFEKALVQKFRQKADFSAKDADVQLKERVKKYLKENLSILIDNKQADLSLVGFEMEEESVNVYMEYALASSPKSFIIRNSILYDVYDDQMSIVHVIVAGKRNTKKINYPDKSERFEF